MANLSGRAVDKVVAVKLGVATLRAEVSGICPESSMAKANRLIREHRERVDQAISNAVLLGD